MPPDTSRTVASDPVIGAERAHLTQSREFLRLMRENVLTLSVNPMAGDPVSLEFLKADLYRRAEALQDLPDAPLFFGRLDYEEAPWDAELVGGAPSAPELTLHIGRRHVADPAGTPVVIDWRAPVSRPFYRASSLAPLGLRRRRRFGFSGGDLTAYEDEVFTEDFTQGGAGGEGRARGEGKARGGQRDHLDGEGRAGREKQPSALLVAEIERPRSGPMRDIVATIQPEQDDIVRADASQTVCVQGAPGTGKTAVGLHRVAYLLYAHKEQVTRRGVIVVGPNMAFLSYIRNVLPALGELDVKQTTVPELLGTVPVRGADSDAAGVVKGDVRMAEVLRRRLWAAIRPPVAPLMVVRGSRRWRVPSSEVFALAEELSGRGVRYGAGRQLLGHRIAHVILSQLEAAGEACDDRTHDAVRRTTAVRRCVDEVWPKVEPKRLVFGLLSDPAELARHAAGVLTPQEQAVISWSPAPRSLGSAKWSRADLALLDEAGDLIERTPSLAHVVADEAQDLSPMEIRALGRRCSTGAATVLGDIAQGTTPWSATSWPTLLSHLGKPDAAVRELDVGYRVPREILDFASQLLPAIAPGLRPASSLRADPSALSIVPVAAGELGGQVVAACAAALGTPGSIAVICADAQLDEVSKALRAAGLAFGVLGSAGEASAAGDGERLCVVPVTLAKGLEFDQVVLVEPGRIATGEVHGLRRLYVALTRAVSRLVVLHSEPLPSALRYVP